MQQGMWQWVQFGVLLLDWLTECMQPANQTIERSAYLMVLLHAALSGSQPHWCLADTKPGAAATPANRHTGE